jgi:hypothetical protein
MIGETDPTPGFFFRGDQPGPSIADQIAILRGNRSASGAEPTDQRYIQSVRSIGLPPGAETDLWVAVIAADDDAAFADAADAAAGDIRNRRQQLLAGESEPVGELEWSYTAPATTTAQAARKPVCGKDCMLKLTHRRFPAGAGSGLSAGLEHQRWLRE